MCLVMALAEGGGSLCHCEPVVVVLEVGYLRWLDWTDNFKMVMSFGLIWKQSHESRSRSALICPKDFGHHDEEDLDRTTTRNIRDSNELLCWFLRISFKEWIVWYYNSQEITSVQKQMPTPLNVPKLELSDAELSPSPLNPMSDELNQSIDMNLYSISIISYPIPILH